MKRYIYLLNHDGTTWLYLLAGRFALARWHLTVSQPISSRLDKITDALSYPPQWYILRPISRENAPISKKPPRPLAAYYNLDPLIPTLENLCLPALPTHLL
ncbi:uncharacterized protein J4E92_006438 [Alternaria infectoria]|uniref:uncharacterized protein n=1 Tax=Alternaria infectoria TaxID=45303 RepID=UPI0022208F20|nr:uncharacterized protein J4E92_006438 [Alternaria infectoria]KAI4927271.1 hypothetical protein J4E92_006438 [Alternaria infectoria]